MVLLTWSCEFGKPRIWSLLPACVALDQRARKAWGAGEESSPACWLQSSAKAQGKDGSRDGTANHWMLRLAENSLASSPSWLVLRLVLPSSCFVSSPVLSVSSTGVAHSACCWQRPVFIVRGPVVLPSPTHIPSRSQCPSAWLFWALLCKVQRQFLIQLLLVQGIILGLPLQSQDALAAILHHSHLSLAPLKSAARGCTDVNAQCMPHFVVAIKNKKSEIDLLIMDVLLTETHPTCS